MPDSETKDCKKAPITMGFWTVSLVLVIIDMAMEVNEYNLIALISTFLIAIVPMLKKLNNVLKNTLHISVALCALISLGLGAGRDGNVNWPLFAAGMCSVVSSIAAHFEFIKDQAERYEGENPTFKDFRTKLWPILHVSGVMTGGIIAVVDVDELRMISPIVHIAYGFYFFGKVLMDDDFPYERLLTHFFSATAGFLSVFGLALSWWSLGDKIIVGIVYANLIIAHLGVYHMWS